MKKQAWLAVVLGAWILLSGFLGFGHIVILVSNLIAGAILMIAGVSMFKVKSWQGWTLFLFGFWLYVAAFLTDLHLGTDLWINNLIVGLVAMLAGFAAVGGKPEPAQV
jgi:hypothetical protein